MTQKPSNKHRYLGMTGGQLAIVAVFGVLVFSTLIIGMLLLLDRSSLAPLVAQATSTPQARPTFPPTWTPTPARTPTSTSTSVNCQEEALVYLGQVRPLGLSLGDDFNNFMDKSQVERELTIRNMQNTREEINSISVPLCAEAAKKLVLSGTDRAIALLSAFVKGSLPVNSEQEWTLSENETALGLSQLVALAEGRATPAAPDHIVAQMTNTPAPSPAVQPTDLSSGNRSSTPSQLRQGWLCDFDRTASIRLWTAASLDATVKDAVGTCLGCCVDVTMYEETLVEGILFYRISVGSQSGWVDVDYFYWSKPGWSTN